MLFRLRTQNFYIYYYQFYYILNIELFQNYNIKIAPTSQYFCNYFWVHFRFVYIKLCESWCLVGSVLLYVKCTAHTNAIVAVVRSVAVAAVSRVTAAAVAVVTTTT